MSTDHITIDPQQPIGLGNITGTSKQEEDKVSAIIEAVALTPSFADTVLILPPPAGTVEQLAASLYRALQNHDQTPVKAIDPVIADIGPSLIRLKVLLKDGQKASNIQRLTLDLQREMELEYPPVIGNLPGTGFVAVEVGRTDREPVLLGPVLVAKHDKPPVSFPAGVEANGKVNWLTLPHLPHMLIGGTTGAGKTLFLYSMVKALTQLNGPETVELVLIDPKQTDFSFFEKLPHLRGGRIIYEPEEAVKVLNDLLNTELPRRTALLCQYECRDIHEYRQQAGAEQMPFIIIIIDEFADLTQSLGAKERKQFEENVGRLAQRTRSLGIHLVVATQRPDIKVIPCNLKSNLDCRVAFRLASRTDSRVILDKVGAEDLLGKGDMLLKQQGQIQRLQGFFISSSELKSS
jgi:DNA segregation ATPase FtsK/SpoIIIE-like protein